MLYGDEKTREMVRSILPSTSDTKSRDMRRVRRKYRRKANQVCRELARDPDLWDDEGVEFPDRERDIDINMLMRERQGYDKLNHFERWAVKVTDGLEPDARMAKMRAILPDNLVGWHARTHLDSIPEFIVDGYRYGIRGSFEGTYPRRHPFEHRYVDPPEPDVAKALVPIIEDPEKREALYEALQAAHRPVVWIMEYKDPIIEEKVYTKLGYIWRYTKGPRPRSRIAEVHMIPVVHRTEVVGPKAPPTFPNHPEDIPSFVEALVAAGEAPKTIKDIPWTKQRETTGRASVDLLKEEANDEALLEQARRDARCGGFTDPNYYWMKGNPAFTQTTRTRPNPAYHPEWLQAVKDFLMEVQNATSGDSLE